MCYLRAANKGSKEGSNKQERACLLARRRGSLSSGDLHDWRGRRRCVGEADLVIRSSHARLGVLRPGHVVACIRITSHELLRDGVRAVAAFLFGRPHRDGFLSGSFSSFPPIWLASLIQQKSGPKAPLAPPQEGAKARTGCQVNPAPLPARSPVQAGASASVPAQRALTPGTSRHGVT